MSYFFKNIKPTNDSDEEGEFEEDPDELRRILQRQKPSKHSAASGAADDGSDDDEDELKTLSFGAIQKADRILEKEAREERRRDTRKPKQFKEEKFEDSSSDSNSDQPQSGDEQRNEESDSDSEGGFFEEDDEDEDSEAEGRSRGQRGGRNDKKQRHKHAPSEQSSKRRVSRIRKIEGLDNNRNRGSSIYQDVRFDKSMGRATDQDVVRRRYAFLDEYREKEIAELDGMLHDRKFMNKVSDYERESMEGELRSMKSRLQSVKNRDLEKNIIRDYEDKMNEGNQTRFHLKKADKRKVVQKWKFDHMKAKQREKVMERKRKKRLGKEFKQFEFHQQR